MNVYVLDIDPLSLHLRGHEPLKAHLLKISPEQLAITIISVEEMFRGRLAQVRKALPLENRVTSYFWLSRTSEYLCGFEVRKFEAHAEAYFEKLREQKIRIGIQHLKIAAIVLSRDATLVTRNADDFKNIPSIKIEDWSR